PDGWNASRAPTRALAVGQMLELVGRAFGSELSKRGRVEPLQVVEELMKALSAFRRKTVLHLAGVRLGDVGRNAENLDEEAHEVGVPVGQRLGHATSARREPHIAPCLMRNESLAPEGLHRARDRGQLHSETARDVGHAHDLELLGKLMDRLEIILVSGRERPAWRLARAPAASGTFLRWHRAPPRRITLG